MRQRLVIAGLAATGSLLTAALTQAAVALADVSPTGDDAFTIGHYTFDPFTLDADGNAVEGFTPVYQLASAPPVLELGGGVALGINLAPQSFAIFDPTTGAETGTIDTNETVTSLFGLTNAEFTVQDSTQLSGAPPLASGSVYDVFNLGHGYENVYTAIPGALPGGDNVTDTLITPNGNIDLTPLFGKIDAAAALQPGDAFTGLQAGDSGVGADAFTIGGITFDPITRAGPEGFDSISPLVSAPPLLTIGGAFLGNPAEPTQLVSQSFDIYSGGGTGATDLGFVQTGVVVTNLLGFTNTEIAINSVDQQGATAAGLPTVGSIYDALNLDNGYENVYVAIPGVDGAKDTVTDTLITPNGNIDLTPLFGNIDAAAPLAPGDAFTGLQAGDSAIGPDAFTVGGFTFDPTLAAGGEGFDPVYQTIGLPPLLVLGGATVSIPNDGLPPAVLPLATQGFDVYDGTTPGSEVASISTNETVTQLLGLTNTEFVITGVSPTGDGALPTAGSVYDVFNLGNGYENIYTAIPGLNGGADTVTDTFITPMGSYNLDSLFGNVDAVALLNPGDALAGLDAGAAAASADPLAFLGL